VREIHDLRTRKMGDLIQVDVHFSVDGHLTVVEGHEVERE
jgi:divalent metal cation (Fe/Co/Zn/Cd) transporter